MGVIPNMGEVDREMRLVDIEPFEAALRSVQKRSKDISIQEVLDTLERYPVADEKEIAQKWIKACDCIYRDNCDYEVHRIIWCAKGRKE